MCTSLHISSMLTLRKPNFMNMSREVRIISFLSSSKLPVFQLFRDKDISILQILVIF